ncbi:MAG: hypothetical protein EA403_15730 [Spirochaetaceae bacterium]|nr:MAG: hypothetical protein EA403_15730 [Spirochaetaceae bacterium]
MVSTFEAARKTVPAGTLEEADLHYDAGFMLWCYELNREPSLSGHYLTFKDWDEQALFLNSVGGENTAWTLLERAASLYEALYEAKKSGGPPGEVIALGIRLTNAWDKLVGKTDSVARVLDECLQLASAAEDWDAAGDLYLSQAHSARYSLYDSPRAFQLLHTAQDCFRRTGNEHGLHRAFLLEMSILDPLANEGRDGNLERYRELLRVSVAFLERSQDFRSLVDLYLQASQRLESYERLDLVEACMIAMLEVVKAHFPQHFHTNLEGTREYFDQLGISAQTLTTLE